MFGKGIDKIIESIINDDEIIYKSLIIKEDLYLTIVNKEYINHIGDDRYQTIGGRGPLKINLKTNKYEWIHYLDIPDEFSSPEIEYTKEDIIESIKNRKWINKDDIFFFTNHFKCNNREYDIYEISDVIGMKTESNKSIIKLFSDLFVDLGCDFLIKEDMHIKVNREIKKP